jgi:hypothetical protein
MWRAAAAQLEQRVGDAAAQCCAPAAGASFAASWVNKCTSTVRSSCSHSWARSVSTTAAVACAAASKGSAEAAPHSEKQAKLFRKVLDGALRAVVLAVMFDLPSEARCTGWRRV